MLHRRFWKPCLAALSCALVLGSIAGAHAEVLDERAAVVRALRHSPALAAARETVAAARARVAAAKTYPHDPVLGLEAGARQAGPATDLDLAVTVEQTLDLGGPRRARREAAEAVTAEALAAYEGARRSLVAQIRIAFVEVLRARAQAALAGTLAEMSTAQVVIVEKRLAVGDATRLDLNLARAEAGRAGADHAAARGVEAVAQPCWRRWSVRTIPLRSKSGANSRSSPPHPSRPPSCAGSP